MGRLLTRYSPVRHAHVPEGTLTFDLHVLSMPPAFILSQNQTLKFNCLKSLSLFKIITALTLLSLCWLCFLGYYKFNFSTLKKLTEITFHLLVCQIKSHFFLIPFLIFWNRTSVRAVALSRVQLVYHTTSHIILSSIFYNFLKLFLIFLKVFCLLCNSTLSRRQLVYYITFDFLSQSFFKTFFDKFFF